MRTALAWGRSTMSLFACGAAIAKGVPKVTGHGRPLIGISMVVLGAIAWISSLPLARSRRSGHGPPHPATAAQLAPLAYGTAAVGLAAFVLASLFPG